VPYLTTKTPVTTTITARLYQINILSINLMNVLNRHLILYVNLSLLHAQRQRGQKIEGVEWRRKNENIIVAFYSLRSFVSIFCFTALFRNGTTFSIKIWRALVTRQWKTTRERSRIVSQFTLRFRFCRFRAQMSKDLTRTPMRRIILLFRVANKFFSFSVYCESLPQQVLPQFFLPSTN
jgi:hypothetical protein